MGEELNGFPSDYRLPVERFAGPSNMSTRMPRCGCGQFLVELLESDSEELESCLVTKSQVLRRYLA